MDWKTYLMGFAEHAARKSKDSTQVGAVLVGPMRDVRLTGFNGPPIGVHETDERRTRPTKYLFASHAEANIIAFAARAGIQTDGCSIYVTHPPCAACTRTLIQAGIRHVVIGALTLNPAGNWEADLEASRQMFEEAGVSVDAIICAEVEPELPLG